MWCHCAFHRAETKIKQATMHLHVKTLTDHFPLYLAPSTHPGNSDVCPHYSQTWRSGRLNIAQTKPTDHRLPVLEQVRRVGLRFPRSGRGALEDADSAFLLTAKTQRDAGRLCLEKHGGTFSSQAALTHLRCFPSAADKHACKPASTESIRTLITSFLVGTKAI